MLKNTGSLTNTGFEFSVDFKAIRTEDFTWDINGNVSVLRNEIEDLGDSAPFYATSTSGHLGVDGSWVEAGNPIGVWRGYKYIGIKEDGSPNYEDKNGDGKYTAEDYSIIGDPNPDFTWGLNSTLRYKGFDFTVFSEACKELIFGICNNQKLEMERKRSIQISNILTDSWTTQNPNASRPAVDAKRDFASYRRSSFFIEDGFFIRLQNISLGYTLPVSKFIRTARIYVSAQNLFIITDYSGFDPEVNNQGQTTSTVGMTMTHIPVHGCSLLVLIRVFVMKEQKNLKEETMKKYFKTKYSNWSLAVIFTLPCCWVAQIWKRHLTISIPTLFINLRQSYNWV